MVGHGCEKNEGKTRRECYRIAVQLYNDRLIREFRIHETRFTLIVRQFELIPSLHHPEMPSTVFNSIGRRHRIAFIPQILLTRFLPSPPSSSNVSPCSNSRMISRFPFLFRVIRARGALIVVCSCYVFPCGGRRGRRRRRQPGHRVGWRLVRLAVIPTVRGMHRVCELPQLPTAGSASQ